jgi:4-hydroxybenzoate polyprenyltransferase
LSEDSAQSSTPADRSAAGAIPDRTSPALIRLLRPRQWSKNLLVFAAAIFADQLFIAASAGRAALAFVAFCLASSSVYVINDLLDAEVDRRHPAKRARPIASGEISKRTAIWIAAALTLAALGLAASINWPFASAIASYIALVHFYSIFGKHIVILDAMLVSMGFVLRAVGGALAIDVPSSSWFVLCTFFAALFLALSKRRAETLSQYGGSQGHRGGSQGHRSVIGQYTESTLASYTSAAIAATAITYSLYAIDTSARFPLLPLTVPCVLFAVFRYHHLVETAGLGEQPEDVFLRDRAFRLSVLAFVAIALTAIYLEA